jgi:hypothetical protein
MVSSGGALSKKTQVKMMLYCLKGGLTVPMEKKSQTQGI